MTEIQVFEFAKPKEFTFQAIDKLLCSSPMDSNTVLSFIYDSELKMQNFNFKRFKSEKMGLKIDKYTRTVGGSRYYILMFAYLLPFASRQ